MVYFVIRYPVKQEMLIKFGLDVSELQCMENDLKFRLFAWAVYFGTLYTTIPNQCKPEQL